MSLRPEVLKAAEYHFSEKDCRIKLDQNESPFDLPQEAQKALFERLSQASLNRYPELNSHSLRASLAAYLAWPAEGLVISNGSNVLLQALVIAAGINQTVLTVKPSFSVYAMQAELLGAELVEIALKDDFSLAKDELLRQLAKDKGVFFLANPAAPTANLLEKADIEQLAEASQDNWIMVIDEAYHQFSGTDYSYLAKRYDHVICLRTFSKAFGLGGLRLGYGLMQEKLATQLQKTLLPFSVSIFQLISAKFILEQSSFVEENTKFLIAERERVFKRLTALSGIQAYPSHTNFILFRVSDAALVYNALLAKGILIRRQDHLPKLSGCLRVSMGLKEENDAFLEAVESIVMAKTSVD